MAKLSSKSLLGIAMILSLILAVLVFNYFNDLQQKSAGQATVVVAKVEIVPNTRITEDMVEAISIPDTYLQPGAKTDIKSVIGVYAKERIMAREQITERLILGGGKNAEFSGTIPPDKRAISISVNDVTGVAGLIKPGDYVDVIVTLDQGGTPTSNMVFQNALVLATNKNVGAGEKEKVPSKDDVKITTVTIALTPDEATTLALAEAKGIINLVLRPYLPTGGGAVMVGVKTLGSLRGDLTADYTPSKQAAPQAQSSKVEPVSDSRSPRSISVIKGTKVQEVPVP